MSEKNTGGPAFPVAEYDHQTFRPANVDEARRLLSGMTLLDYFAAQALPACYAEACRDGVSSGWPENWRIGVALDAYLMADAMLKARSV